MAKIKSKKDTVDMLWIEEDGDRVITRDMPAREALRQLGDNFYIDDTEKEFNLVAAMDESKKYRKDDFEIEGEIPTEDEAFWAGIEKVKAQAKNSKETKNADAPRKSPKRD